MAASGHVLAAAAKTNRSSRRRRAAAPGGAKPRQRKSYAKAALDAKLRTLEADTLREGGGDADPDGDFVAEDDAVDSWQPKRSRKAGKQLGPSGSRAHGLRRVPGLIAVLTSDLKSGSVTAPQPGDMIAPPAAKRCNIRFQYTDMDPEDQAARAMGLPTATGSNWTAEGAPPRLNVPLKRAESLLDTVAAPSALPARRLCSVTGLPQRYRSASGRGFASLSLLRKAASGGASRQGR